MRVCVHRVECMRVYLFSLKLTGLLGRGEKGPATATWNDLTGTARSVPRF